MRHNFYQECECGWIEHVIKFEYHDELPDLFVYYYLPKQPFLKRLVNAVKYIFGYKSQYGDFGETVINDVEPLMEFLAEFAANRGVEIDAEFPLSNLEAALNTLSKSMAGLGGKLSGK